MAENLTENSKEEKPEHPSAPDLPEIPQLSEEDLEEMKREDEQTTEKGVEEAKKEIEDAYKTDETKEKKQPEELERMDQRELKSLKNGFERLVESVQRLRTVLLERDQDGLNPLIDSERVSKLKISAMDLKSAITQSSIESEELKNAIYDIIAAIDNIGNISRRPRKMKEREESLVKVSSCLKHIQDNCGSVLRKLRSVKKPEAKDFEKLILRLGNKTGDKVMYVRRKRTDLEKY